MRGSAEQPARPAWRVTNQGWKTALGALLALVFAACSSVPTPPSRKPIRISILAPEWEIESQILSHTPLGTPDEMVLGFVQEDLLHSADAGVHFQSINVGPVRLLDAFSEDIVFKTIQVHMGIHGSNTKTLMQEGHWVYVGWVFDDENKLIDVVVHKVVPRDLLEPETKEDFFEDPPLPPEI